MEEFYIRFRRLPYDNFTTTIKAKNKKQAIKKAIDSWCDEHFENIEIIEVYYNEEF